MEVRQSRFDVSTSASSTLNLLFEGAGTGEVLVGTAQIKAGQLLPAQDFSVHESDEYSYVLRGELRVVTPEETRECKEGTFMLLRAGEPHRIEAIQDSEVLWWWSGRADTYLPLKEKYPLPVN